MKVKVQQGNEEINSIGGISLIGGLCVSVLMISLKLKKYPKPYN